MKPKYLLSLIILIIGMVFVSGCTAPASSEQKCPECQSPGTWSACTGDALKLRANYRCSIETNYACERYTEEKACETEIILKSGKGSIEVIVSPTLDETIKGVIKAEAVSVPEKTEMVKFIFAPQDVEIGQNMDVTKVIIEVDRSGLDGWKAFFDTKKLDNGLYRLAIGSTYKGAPDENPWLDYTATQVVVKN